MKKIGDRLLKDSSALYANHIYMDFDWFFVFGHNVREKKRQTDGTFLLYMSIETAKKKIHQFQAFISRALCLNANS